MGRGGMSDVHLGTDTRLGRQVAIKLLKPSLASDPKFRMLFREEAQKAARMAHPTIVRVFDAGEETVRDSRGMETQVPFIVMEYVDGRNLKDIIAEGPLDSSEAVRIVSGILTALEYAHRALLVHRDIKPGNVMVTSNGQVKVMDFGIARAVSDNSATVTDTSAILGTAQYFSPEQARGETVDARTDLYSTGVVLFELLTGRAPFQGERAAAVAYQHISEAPPKPSSINQKVSPALDAIVLRSLAKDKFERFQTAPEFREDLEAAASGAVPAKKIATPDFNQALFGVNPSGGQTTTAAIRQLSSGADDRVQRTQSRPPVAWIWGGIVATAVVLIGLMFWVVNLTAPVLAPNISVVVPHVVGQPYEAGATALTELDLVPERRAEASAIYDEGLIIRTLPEAGERVAADQVVQVWVSTGRTLNTIPMVVNMSVADARTAIEIAGFEVGTTTTQNSPDVPANTVMGTSPEQGTAAAEGTVVNLIVSDGLVAVPDTVGQPINEAASTLRALNLSVTLQPDTGCSGSTVTSQSLAAGQQAQRSPVTLRYCAG
ncbi:MAG TPA: Stk1 family PASTA domain-containing Ser/Thr kinase [Terrimesophilobacter sp.]|nr:Stk1 family PASTA domain-containing Ser/Thr kinase [Terrimesophilobacter sp.]